MARQANADAARNQVIAESLYHCFEAKTPVEETASSLDLLEASEELHVVVSIFACRLCVTCQSSGEENETCPYASTHVVHVDLVGQAKDSEEKGHCAECDVDVAESQHQGGRVAQF